MSTGLTVAKKKQGPAQRPEGKPEASPRTPTPTPTRTPDAGGPDFLRVRVSGAYKAWVTRFAVAERSDMSDLIDDALAAYAKAQGFETPPKR
jgi:hypothetical protein